MMMLIMPRNGRMNFPIVPIFSRIAWIILTFLFICKCKKRRERSKKKDKYIITGQKSMNQKHLLKKVTA